MYVCRYVYIYIYIYIYIYFTYFIFYFGRFQSDFVLLENLIAENKELISSSEAFNCVHILSTYFETFQWLSKFSFHHD